MDLMDGFYQILMRERDIPYTAVSTPSGMFWEWLVIPQGLSNALVVLPSADVLRNSVETGARLRTELL